MSKERGRFTKVADEIGRMITKRDFVTTDGECVDLHKGIINDIVCDVTNKILEQEEKKKNNEIYIAIKNQNKSIYNIGGHFYHLLFGNVLDLDLDDNHMIRFCKLCAYLNYDNVLVQGETNGQSKILESDLINILNLSERETRNTKKYLLDKKLISINSDGVITVNRKYAIKGSVEGDKNMTRVFKNGFNELYDGVSSRQHKQLAIFIKILPYLNNEFNILCENPNETDIRLVKPLKWSELGEKIGLTKEQSKQLKQKLWKMKIKNKVVFGEFGTFVCGKSIVINPSVFWKSNNGNISDISKLFEIGNL